MIIGFSLLTLSFLYHDILLFKISVFIATPAMVPIFLHLRKAFNKPVKGILGIFYVSLITLKFYDFIYTQIINSKMNSELSLSRARGLIGSISLTIEMVLIVGMLTYVVLASLTTISKESIKKVLFSWELALIIFASALTITIMANYRLTGLYFILIELFTLLIVIFFYERPLVSSLLHRKMYGVALIDLNGEVLDFKIRDSNKLGGRLLEEEFFSALKVLLLRIKELSLNTPTLLEFNNKELLTFVEIPDKIITIYGWGLDKNTYNYLKLLLEKSDHDYNKFWSSLKDKVL